MTKLKGIIYATIMAITLIGEIVFLSLALPNHDWIMLVGVGVFYAIQAILGGLIFVEAVFKQNSESHWTTMGALTLIPFGQIVSSYFLYRVCKGE